MGCSASGTAGGAPKLEDESTAAGCMKKRLRDEYAVGETLGEGSCGLVYACTKRATCEEFAVKMIRHNKISIEAIRAELDMVQTLDHKNIMKVYGLFYVGPSVCIVMDKYAGGNLYEALEQHTQKTGRLPACLDLVHVARQMGLSIQYLHAHSIVHLDVKGENFVMAYPDIIDERCHVVLTDFGAAARTVPGERLVGSTMGTKEYWAPELVSGDFSFKVDVWAMGITMYVLVTGHLPFGNGVIAAKPITIPNRCPAVCKTFIMGQLERIERCRFNADDVVNHHWFLQKHVRSVGDAVQLGGVVFKL